MTGSMCEWMRCLRILNETQSKEVGRSLLASFKGLLGLDVAMTMALCRIFKLEERKLWNQAFNRIYE